MKLANLQIEQRIWMKQNFPDREPWMQLVGAMEELGELAHAHLKRAEKVRDGEAKFLEQAKDAVGDIVIFLAGYCNDNGLDLERCVADTWKKVRARNWIKCPVNGESKPASPNPSTAPLPRS
jgi:NTP pyrophosphatase (non-canonical NTP hydrolase)